jgi:hypothetical protein
MKKTLFVVLILSLSLLAACNAVSLEEAEAQFCEDLSSFQTALSAYRALDENSTLDEVNQATVQGANAYDDLVQSARILRDVQSASLDEQYDVLEQTVRDLEGEMTVGQASADIEAAVASIDAAADEIYSTSCQ